MVCKRFFDHIGLKSSVPGSSARVEVDELLTTSFGPYWHRRNILGSVFSTNFIHMTHTLDAKKRFEPPPPPSEKLFVLEFWIEPKSADGSDHFLLLHKL